MGNDDTMKDGKFGPDSQNNYYQPKKEHWHKAQPAKGKTRWCHDRQYEFYVFKLADEHDEMMPLASGDCDKRWMNDDGKGLYSIVEGGLEKLGEHDERLAFFPTPQNSGDPWHGYPVKSTNIKDNLIDYWSKNDIITYRICKLLLRHKI